MDRKTKQALFRAKIVVVLGIIIKGLADLGYINVPYVKLGGITILVAYGAYLLIRLTLFITKDY